MTLTDDLDSIGVNISQEAHHHSASAQKICRYFVGGGGHSLAHVGACSKEIIGEGHAWYSSPKTSHANGTEVGVGGGSLIKNLGKLV